MNDKKLVVCWEKLTSTPSLRMALMSFGSTGLGPCAVNCVPLVSCPVITPLPLSKVAFVIWWCEASLRNCEYLSDLAVECWKTIESTSTPMMTRTMLGHSQRKPCCSLAPFGLAPFPLLGIGGRWFDRFGRAGLTAPC